MTGRPDRPESWISVPPGTAECRSMSDAGTAPDRDDHQRRSRDPRPLGPRAGGRVEPVAEKLEACDELEQFRRTRRTSTSGSGPRCSSTRSTATTSRTHPAIRGTGLIPFAGFMDLMERRYEQAIAAFLEAMRRDGPNGAIASALAQAYEQVAFQTLADQVRRSVRSCQGNRWMFRVGGVDEHPLRIHPRLLERESDDALFPILVERTPVRLDLSHSGWSDIFFLGMDFPEGARVLNISVDLGVHGRDDAPAPPIETPAAGHHRADPAPDQHRPERLQGRRQPGRAVQLRQRLPGPGQGGRGRLGADPAFARGDARRGSPTCWRGSSGRATGWRSSARSTTSPRGRGWRSRPTCWPR